jgi:hypothetical protein
VPIGRVVALPLLLLASLPSAAVAQVPDGNWRQAAIEITKKASDSLAAARAETERLIAEGKEPNVPMPDLHLEEYYTRVIQPRLAAARTCSERLDAIGALLAFDHDRQVFNVEMKIEVPYIGEILVGKYAEDTFNRCMNESYRRCVANDDPGEVFQMVRWTLEWERRRQLMGLDPALDFSGELDPRITACRGPLYRVRIAYAQEDEQSYTRGRMEGWIGRGITRDVLLHVETRGPGPMCPDGSCGDTCYEAFAGDGRGRIEPNLWTGEFFLSYDDEAYQIRKTEDTCPAESDAPEPTGMYNVRVEPADPVPALAEGEPDFSLVPADPVMIAAVDPWKHQFAGPGAYEMLADGAPFGTMEVVEVCDGREMHGRGTASCKALWQRIIDETR